MSEPFTMPIWTCPACKKEQQYDEYYDLKADSEMTCQYCERVFTVSYVDTVMLVSIDEATT